MKQLIALAVIASASASAHAQAPAADTKSTTTIKPPTGWHLDNEQSAALSAKLNTVGHFGLPPNPGKGAIANADVYVGPKPGVVLNVILVGGALTQEREAAARASVDELHAESQRAALAGSGIVEDGWQEKVDSAAKQIEATLAWRDTTAKTSSTARMLIVGDAEHLITLTGECFASDDADAKDVAACKAALATLDPGLDPAKRASLALAPAGARPTAPEPTGADERPAGPAQAPARMGDASHVPLPPISVPQEARTTDRRPVYVGFGIVVLAAIFWWNRHRRARDQEEPNE
jgi:hypothetical protein